MRNLKDGLILLAGGIAYLFSALVWEIAIARITIWWGEQFIQLRPTLTGYQPLGYTIVGLFFMLVVIPQFFWFPVLFFKELKELWDEPHVTPVIA
jgi:hypothetical protein